MNSAFNATMDCGSELLLGADDLRDLGEFAANYQRWLNQLEGAHREGDRKAVKQHTGRILKSFGAKVCVTVRAIKLQPGQGSPTFAESKARAAALDPLQPINEPVTTWLEPKIAGGYRQLVSFRRKRRALQIHVRGPLVCRISRGPLRLFGGRHCNLNLSARICPCVSSDLTLGRALRAYPPDGGSSVLVGEGQFANKCPSLALLEGSSRGSDVVLLWSSLRSSLATLPTRSNPIQAGMKGRQCRLS
jgi:hypothetical protein